MSNRVIHKNNFSSEEEEATPKELQDLARTTISIFILITAILILIALRLIA